MAKLSRLQRKKNKERNQKPKSAPNHYENQLLSDAIKLHKAGDLEEAEKFYLRILRHNPRHADALHLMGVMAYQKSDLNQAIALIGKALEINPNNAAYYLNLGNAMFASGRKENAAEFFHRALIIDPSYVEASNNLGAILHDTGEWLEEETIYEKALKHNPNNGSLLNSMVKTLRDNCSWENIDAYIKKLISHIDDSPCPISPYHSLCLALSLEQKHDIAKKFAKNYFTNINTARRKLDIEYDLSTKKKLRIGYVSADFRDHPTSHLINGLFKNHDRDNFEIFAYSIGANDESQYRKNIEENSDHFIDLINLSDDDAARKINEDKIDILVDVMGYIENSRPQIFAFRPAPIQINFLAYPGTMGADFIDYLVTDKNVIEQEEEKYYTEKLIYMPDSYFITDNEQKISKPLSRKEYGLPDDAFVFCSFNKSSKIDSKVLDSWANILKAAPGSVLWLYSDNEYVEGNLIKEAKKREIDSSRIIFAKRLPKEEHLARYKHADLFLDCFIVNAHTTAIDALWAGVPVLTLKGDSIISRASSSILSAIGLNELSVSSTKDYEEKAIGYAKNNESLNELKEKLETNKKSHPLFDTEKYVRNLEKAFNETWKKRIGDFPNENINV